MEIESIRDPNGKEYIVFNAQESNNDDSMGDKFEDFEPLQLLGQGSFGKVIKVSSLINQKIYAMKILNLEVKEEEGITKEMKEQYFLSEIELLKKLDHPNIVKYYKSFREDDKFYIIMEYFDNGDLEDYIEVLKNDNQINKKEEIWNIFYQCISGLSYLHSKGVIHRDIKPPNIFMTKNKIIKLGDFGVSAIIGGIKGMTKIHKLKYTQVGTPLYMAPEILANKQYKENIDVFSMGCVFYKIICQKDYQKEEFLPNKEGKFEKKIQSKRDFPNNYDQDLMNVVREMVNEDERERPDSGKILTKIKDNYNKIFIKNSGIYAVIRCMINLPYTHDHFLNKFKNIYQSSKIDDKSQINQNKPYSEKFLFCIENENNWIENITFYRHKIIEENNFLNNNKEINPYLIFTFILDKIHGELNKVTKVPDNTLMKKRSSFIDPNKEEKVKREYIRIFNANFNSNISNHFVMHMETIRKCCVCNLQTFLFTYFFSLKFDLNLPLLEQKKEIELVELFKIQNNISLDLKGLNKVKCNKCNIETEQSESKIFYIFPNQLVLGFDRGINYNKIQIKYPEKLDLSSIPKDEKFSPKLFTLVGVIKRCDIGIKEHYISLIFNSSENTWYLYDNEKKEKIKSQSKHKEGDIVMLFYVVQKKN